LVLAAAAERAAGPLRDQDYPSWLLTSIAATPDRSAALDGSGESPLPALAHALTWLAGAPGLPGADFAVMACMTAHRWLPELRAESPIPLLDAIDEALRAATSRSRPGARIGVLATSGALPLFAASERALPEGRRTLSLLDLERGERLQEELVMTPIFGAAAADGRRAGGLKAHRLDEARPPLERAVARLGEAGAELVITACSELPLALGREPVAGVALLDPMQIVAEACVAIAAKERPLPSSA